jgi:hypothetical protein
VILCITAGAAAETCTSVHGPRSAAQVLGDANCSASTRGGIALFTPHRPDRSQMIRLLQCGDSLPDISALARGELSAASYAAKTALANLLWALERGHAYAFYLQTPDTGRNPSWCRVRAMRHALTESPLPIAALYMDTDAYILTEQHLTLDHLHAGRFHRAIPLDEGDEEWPGIYVRGVPANLSHDTPMPLIKRAFDEDGEFLHAMGRQDMLNTGGGWLELGHRPSTISFLDRFYAAGETHEGGRFKHAFSHEQRVLSTILSQPDADRDRRETALLEDAVYNSPRSPCIVHLYGGAKNKPACTETLDATLLRRLSRVRVPPPRSLERWTVRAVGDDWLPRWSPHAVNAQCPVYLHCNTGEQGLGNQLENAVFCLDVAQRIGAAVVSDGFRASPGHFGVGDGGSIPHVAEQLLGLRLKPLSEAAGAIRIEVPYAAVGPGAAPCNSLAYVDMDKCERGWCDSSSTYTRLAAVQHVLRGADAKSRCPSQQPAPGGAARVVWHVRNGDRCLHCGNGLYFKHANATLYSLLAGRPFFLEFELYAHMPALKYAFPDATIRVGSPLTEVACRFLNSDILVTDGSSLPVFIVAFAPVGAPVVLEERRKEAVDNSDQFTHFLPDSIRMIDGIAEQAGSA